LGFRGWGSGEGSEFRVLGWGSGRGAQGSGFGDGDQGLGLKVYLFSSARSRLGGCTNPPPLKFGVRGLGVGVRGLGLLVWG